MANETQMVYDGTDTQVIATTGTITDGTWTVDSTNATITEFDNSAAGDRWPYAIATIQMPDTFETATPTLGSTIDLYYCNTSATPQSITETVPTTTLQKSAKYLGSWVLYATDENQPQSIVISLAGIKKCKFFFQNNSGATLSFSSGCTVDIEGFTYGPAA